MSERPDSLTVPRQVQWILYGETGAAIADQVQSLLPGNLPEGQISSAIAVVMIADRDVSSQRMAEDLLAATSRRENRVWLVLPPGVASPLNSQETSGIEADRLDATVVLQDSPPKLSAAALAAWILLRHDAPSSALSGLRDTRGDVCNVAVVAGALPAAPPQFNSPRRQRIDLDTTTYLSTIDSESRLRADELVEECGTDYVRVIEDIPVLAREVAESACARMLDDWQSATAEDLKVALTSVPDDSKSPDSALSKALLRVGELSAAVAREESGFGGWWGRRRRIVELNNQLSAARTEWSDQVRHYCMTTTRTDFSRIAEAGLRARIDVLEHDEREHTGRSREQAYLSWFAGAEATAAAIANIGVSPVHHAWGSANPQTRRHLLLPTLDHEITTQESDVVVHEVPGLPAPLAVAIVLGLPMSSVDLR